MDARTYWGHSLVRKIFVEGGGNNNDALAKECRDGFTRMLQKADLKGRLPRVVPCGGRTAAFRDFQTALEQSSRDDRLFLLVDSEGPVEASSAWQHVAERPGDRWQKPPKAEEDHLHLMVPCMEGWFLADRPALKKAFAGQLDESVLPDERVPVEKVAKKDLFRALHRCLRVPKSPKRRYDKGEHSFRVLAQIDPARVRAASPWAERFFSTLERLL